MKVTTAIFLAQFVESSPPVWWSNYTADQRFDMLEDNVPVLFETHFNTTKHAHLKRHYTNVINKVRRTKTNCQSVGSAAPDWPSNPMDHTNDYFMETGVSGVYAQRDISGFTFLLDQYIRWEIWNLGGKCICEAERLVRSFHLRNFNFKN